MDEYLTTAYEPEMDYVDGMLEDRNVGEWDHSSLQLRVIQLLLALNTGLFIRPELRIRVSPTRCRVPDIAVFEKNPNEQVPGVPPLLVVEVLSPEDRTSRVMRKLHDYRAMGCANVWVLDPQDRIAYQFDGTSLTEVKDQLTLTNRFSIQVPDVFATEL